MGCERDIRLHISLKANLQAKQSHPPLPFLHRGSELRLPVSEALVEPTMATTTTTKNVKGVCRSRCLESSAHNSTTL